MWLIRWGKKIQRNVLGLLIDEKKNKKTNKQTHRVTLVSFSSLRCLLVRRVVQTIFPTVSRPLRRTRPRPFRRSARTRSESAVKIGRVVVRATQQFPVGENRSGTLRVNRLPVPADRQSTWADDRRANEFRDRSVGPIAVRARRLWPWTCACAVRGQHAAHVESGTNDYSPPPDRARPSCRLRDADRRLTVSPCTRAFYYPSAFDKRGLSGAPRVPFSTAMYERGSDHG